MNAKDLVAPVAEDIIRMAAEVEASRCLPPALKERLVEAGLFSIYTPRAFGGLELPLPEALRVVEETARLDGSVGWTVALGFANDLFTSVLRDEVAGRMFVNGSALIAGAFGPNVRAEEVEGGYLMSGQWAFCSGAANADWASVAAPVFDGDTPRMGPAGPEMVMAFFPPSDVEIVDTWHVTGLRGTASHDLRVDRVFVPREMTGEFSMPAGPKAVRQSILARIPFMTMTGIGQPPAVCLGIAGRAIEEFRQLARGKERPFGPRLSEQDHPFDTYGVGSCVNCGFVFFQNTVQHAGKRFELTANMREGSFPAYLTVHCFRWKANIQREVDERQQSGVDRNEAVRDTLLLGRACNDWHRWTPGFPPEWHYEDARMERFERARQGWQDAMEKDRRQWLAEWQSRTNADTKIWNRRFLGLSFLQVAIAVVAVVVAVRCAPAPTVHIEPDGAPTATASR